MAIIRYLGRKFNLAATSDPELGREDMVMHQLHDLVDRILVTVYHKQPYASDEDLEKEMIELKKSWNSQLELLEKYLQNRVWFTGDKLSYVDFLAYEFLDWYRELVEPISVDKNPKVDSFMKRFESLDRLKEYLASDAYRKDAVFGPFAKFGNKKKV